MMKSILKTFALALAIPALAFSLTSCGGDDHDHSDETPEEHADHK